MKNLNISENEITKFIDTFNEEYRYINIHEIGRLEIKNFLIKFSHLSESFKISIFSDYCLSNDLTNVVK